MISVLKMDIDRFWCGNSVKSIFMSKLMRTSLGLEINQNEWKI